MAILSSAPMPEIVEFLAAIWDLFTSDLEFALVLSFFIAVIVPGIISMAWGYRPRDFLGYFSKCAFCVLSVCLAVISPLSLFLFFLYRYLHRLFQGRKSPRATPPQTTPVAPAKVSSTPAQPPIRREAEPKDDPYYRICHFTWVRSIAFCDSALKNHSALCQAYIWTAFFYSITKHIRNQEIVDRLYTQFLPSAEPFIPAGSNGVKVLSHIQAAYRKFRNTLNASEIDPRNQAGVSELWAIAAQWACPDTQPPSSASMAFAYNVYLVTNHALTLLGLAPPEETVYYMEAANGMTVRVPESQLEAWTARQEELRKNPDAGKLTDEQLVQLRKAVKERIYGTKEGGADGKA